MTTKIFAGLLGACLAAPALAQSNVTIYGIADAGVHVSNNGEGTKAKLVSGIADGSRLGFKGLEDMGGGYKAIFNLEARVELDTGSNQTGNIGDNQGLGLSKGMVFPAPVPQLAPLSAAALAAARGAMQPAITVNSNGALFDRTSMLGLVTPAGTLMAGRMYTPAYEIFAGADTFETGFAGTWSSIISGSGGLLTAGIAVRSDKALQYRIALPNGVSAALMYGFKHSGYVGLDDKFIAANVVYKANGWNVGLGHNHGYDQNGRQGLVTSTAGGSYDIGTMKFFAGYQVMKNDNSVLVPVLSDAWDTKIAPALIAKGGPADLVNGVYTPIFKDNLARNFKLDANSISVGLHYRIGNGRIMASISHQNDQTANNNDATLYALGYDYNLSKRTDVYTVLAYIKNDNGAQYASGAASAPCNFTSAGGEAGRAFQVGMRHRF